LERIARIHKEILPEVVAKDVIPPTSRYRSHGELVASKLDVRWTLSSRFKTCSVRTYKRITQPPKPSVAPTSVSPSVSVNSSIENDPCNIVILTTWSPRMCGIATFSEALRNGLLAVCPSSSRVDVIAVKHRDQPSSEYNETEVKHTFREYEVLDYVETAQYINQKDYRTVLVQYEYGMLYGDNLVCLLRELSSPQTVITTLHTVHIHLDENIHAWVQQVAFLSTKIVVMTHSMRHALSVYHAIPTRDIAVIPHGGPDLPYVRYDGRTRARKEDSKDGQMAQKMTGEESREGSGKGSEEEDPSANKETNYQTLFPGKKVILSNGLIHQMKGIEYVIRAMPRVLEEIPNAVYLIHGRPHPSGTGCEEYYQSIQNEAKALAPEAIYFNRSYAYNEDLYLMLQNAAVYVNAYTDEGQSVSGTLAMALGLGTVSISTPYSYALEMLKNNTGKLIPFRNVDALADAIIEVLRDENEDMHEEMSLKAYQAAQGQTWKKVAKGYLQLQ
jgi:glycosyltransferase involved in cell wall biosynthesis